MEESNLVVKFIWMPTESELPEISSTFQSKLQKDLPQKLPASLLKLKHFLNKLLDFSVCIRDFKPKIMYGSSEERNSVGIPSATMFHATYLYVVTCDIEYNKSKCEKLVTTFCTKKTSSLPALWLEIDVSTFLTDPLSTKDSFIDLKYFSLGNIVKLNEFVEHFNSENSLDAHDYKITQVKVKFLHDQEMLHVHFVVGNSKVHVKKRNASTHRMFKLVIPYSSLHTVLICQKKCFSVYFWLYKPPMLFGVQQDEDEDCISYMDQAIGTKWLRSLSLFKGCPSDIRKEFTMNTVLCLIFPNKDYEMLKIMFRHKSVQIYFSSMNVIPYTYVKPKLQLTDFDCYYGFQCLITHSYQILDSLMDKNEMDLFRNFVTEKCVENAKALCNSFYAIHSSISRCNMIILNHSLKMLYTKFSQTSTDPFNVIINNMNNQRIINVKRAVIIPTHVRFLPPQPLLKSRALRSCNPDFSLRITIRDANLETINFSFKGFMLDKKKYLKEFFDMYYKKSMLRGIKIGERHYNYVGSSTSQLKGHGLWFYATDNKGKTAKCLRETFGDMAKIKQVPKYMARMGQTFSQARGNIQVPQKFTNIDCPEVDEKHGIKEYLSEDEFDKKFLVLEKVYNENEAEDPYIFSDGIGRISKEIAEQIYVELDVEESCPSAMQIRYAGCKGMLVVDPTLQGKQIIFRESMKKFISDHDSLEIIKFSEKRAASLNRPLITILEQLGVPKEVFIKLQKDMIQNHIKSMFYEPEARDFLNRNSKLRFDFMGMHNVGMHFTEDPLFRSMIYALFQKQLDLLKSKANIIIPANKGRVMFGVFDETYTLEYGEVFVQYSDWKSGEPKILEETIVVTKNPCMHPGDVRKFKAVDVKGLHHIRDCIVFPAKGHRPHPDEMAGSDLDGDEYQVMWYEEFIFNRDNEPPMHFAMPKDDSKNLERTIEPADELDHVCDYIVNDNVGLIAHAHLVFADRDPKGIFGERCTRLAKKYAISLDFAKSGRTAVKDKRDRVFTYPDFMQKFGERNTYISKKALGVLYRNCKRLELGLETSNDKISYKLDPDLVHEHWERYQKSALRMYKKYCLKVEYLMNIYSFDSEGQLLAGAIINTPKYYEQRHDLDNLMTLLEYEVQGIFNDLRTIFFSEFSELQENFHKLRKDLQYTDEMYQKASAWYMVAYSKIPGKVHNYFGFPWAVADVLIKLKAQKCRLKSNKVGNCKSLLEETIDQCLSRHLPAVSEDSEIQAIYEKRLAVLDVADKVLNKWLKTQQNHIFNPRIKNFSSLINSEFATVSEALCCCDPQYIMHLKKTNSLKKALSPAYYVIETLLQLACIKTTFKKLSFNDVRQELGLLSWVTLIKLACTYNPHYLSIPDKDGNVPESIIYLPIDNVISIFRVNLFDKPEYNEEFSFKLVHEPHKVIKYLKKISGIKNVDFRFSSDDEKKFISIFTVMGTRYAIEKLKDIVVQDEFFQWVVNKINPFEVQ